MEGWGELFFRENSQFSTEKRPSLLVFKSSGLISPLIQVKCLSGHWVLEKFDVIEMNEPK